MWKGGNLSATIFSLHLGLIIIQTVFLVLQTMSSLVQFNSSTSSNCSPAAKRFLVNCRLKIAPVITMVTKDTSTWSIAKKHNTLSCTSITTTGPKSFSVVMARKTTSSAEWKTHQKMYISGASGGFFQVVEVVQNKDMLNSSSQLSTARPIQRYTVCNFVILHYIKVIQSVLK